MHCHPSNTVMVNCDLLHPVKIQKCWNLIAMEFIRDMVYEDGGDGLMVVPDDLNGLFQP